MAGGDYDGLYDRIQRKYDIDSVTREDIENFIYPRGTGTHEIKYGFKHNGSQRYKTVSSGRAAQTHINQIWELAKAHQEGKDIDSLPSEPVNKLDYGSNKWYDKYVESYYKIIKEAVDNTNDIRKLKSWDRFEDPKAAKIIKDKILNLTATEGERVYIQKRDEIFTMSESEVRSLSFDDDILSEKQKASLERAKRQRLEELEREKENMGG